ncbi:ComF family protein [Streptomyces sp. Ag109_O5-10]|uniref:ComF family protein n=1 Tax=Streptomyces sp. Ag109_O5-10 TaxID=1855349 RepID=UPI00089CEFE0|nr:ComF family protein [Streptomyces sp. Ag109_O5-10]SEF01599.1 Predicted amidophosphoribosyltransferases [Streptomyces sp. Ag109_O5-10]
MRGWWQDLTDLVLPAECGGCGTSRTVLCDGCRAALSGAVPRRVRPVPEPSGLPQVYAAAPYADEVRAALLAHKERGALALAGALGAALAGAVRAGLRAGFQDGPAGLRDGRAVRTVASWHGTAGGTGASGPVLLVPVPSAPWAVRARGHDPVRRMTLAAAAELRRAGTPARVVPVLRQRRAVADQSGLNARQRYANLAGALEVTAGGARLLAGGRVVLVDDLVTTGATLAEAARAVREATQAEGAGETTTAVYRRAAWAGREERKTGPAEERAKWARNASGKAEVNGLAGPVRAAVVAAAPDSFEMNRN